MTPSYVLTESAERDLESIVDFTLAQWGKTQAANYLDGLEQCLAQLAQNPLIGTNKDEIMEGLLGFPYAKHVLYYLIAPPGIVVLRVLHGRMNPYLHVSPKAMKPNDYGQSGKS